MPVSMVLAGLSVAALKSLAVAEPSSIQHHISLLSPELP
jgi:hypothetical protein